MWLFKGIIVALVILSIYLILFDNFHPFYFSSIVHPLSIYPILTTALILIGTNKIKFSSQFNFFYLFVIYASITTIMSLSTEFEMKQTTSYHQGLKGLVSLIGFSSSIVVFSLFAKNYYDKMLIAAINVAKFIVVFGSLQLFSDLIDLNLLTNFLKFITGLFSSSTQEIHDRIRLFTHESSWAVSQIVVFIVPVLLLEIIKNDTLINRSYVFLSLLLLLYTKSGLAILYIFGIFGWFLLKELRYLILTLRMKKILLFLPLLIIPIFFTDFFSSFFTYQFNKVSNIIENQGIFQEFSTAARIGNFYTAILVFLDNPFFGVGLGQFGFYYPDYVPEVFVQGGEANNWADKFSSYYATTKSLPARLLAETGLIGFLFFSLFFYKQISCLRKINTREAKVYMLALYGVLIWALNSDSLMQIYVWFIVAMLISYIKNVSKN